MKIFLDDVRFPPKFDENGVEDTKVIGGPDWEEARTPMELMKLLLNSEELVTEISLDHDLEYYIGDEEITGYHCLLFILMFYKDKVGLPTIKFHTANPVGRKRMEDLLEAFLKEKKKIQ